MARRVVALLAAAWLLAAAHGRDAEVKEHSLMRKEVQQKEPLRDEGEAWPVARPAEKPASSQRSRPAVRRKIYTYWEYPGRPDPFVTLNLRTWRAHAPRGVEIVLVNDSNIRELVPDLPEEWFRLPYPAVKSDLVRAAVLYHQGGLYLDTDFLVMGSLDEVFRRLDDGWDIVTYDGEESRKRSGRCEMKSFSSNFMAARPGNGFSRTWWENIKIKLGRVCAAGEFKKQKVCCHEALAKKPEKRPCHVPWASLELLKIPEQDPDARRAEQEGSVSAAEGSAPRRKAEQQDRPALEIPEGVRLFCFAGAESLAPHFNGEVYWQPWAPPNAAFQSTRNASDFDARFDCQELQSGDLSCTSGNWGTKARVLKSFFGRLAYHLFFSQHRAEAKSETEVLSGGWLLSDLYRRSLSCGRPPPEELTSSAAPP